MASKYELSISTEYVPEWGVTEAVRELFQNALDNEITNPENKMTFGYDNKTETLKVSNKTSVLKAESLLLGCGTKHDSKDTIGKHGEGYKIAFMVLLRSNKKITVYNYGANEIWKVKLVKNRKYNGMLVPTVIINKEPLWERKPINDLTIEIQGINEDEYNDIVSKNLHLRPDTINKISHCNRGSILTNSCEAGNIYVKGLFVTHVDGYDYGYDFEPSIISLDRDRRLVSTFDISWQSSILWQIACENDKEACEMAIECICNKTKDTLYVSDVSYSKTALYNAVAEDFYAKHGTDAVPVTSNFEYETIKNKSNYEPIFVDTSIAKMVKESSISKDIEIINDISVKDRLSIFRDKIKNKISFDELQELDDIISDL